MNAETGGGDAALGADMQGFLRELKSLAAVSGQRVTWYDSMTVNGAVSWQGALNARNQPFFQAADSMFVDFRWTAGTLASSGQRAQQLGRSRYELWAGVDVESNGWNSKVDWDAMVPTGASHVTSVGFYRPEWTRHQLPADGRTPGAFHAADDRFWTGRSLDPTRPDGTDRWRAPAVTVADRSTVVSMPFASVFNTGHGLRWYENGEVASDAPWNHLGLQDCLPSRRWAVRTAGVRPTVTFDFAQAWSVGSSVLVDGALDAPVTLDLYATRLALTGETLVELTHRADTGSVRVELAVATAEPGTPGTTPPYSYFPVSPSGAWQTSTVRLTGSSGTIRALGVRLTPTTPGAPVRWRLGRLAVRADQPHPAPAAPTAFRVTAASGGDLRLAWQQAPGEVRHHTLHRVLPDGSRRFLGGTCQRAWFAGGLRPEQGEQVARFELRSVGELYTSSDPVTVHHTW